VNIGYSLKKKCGLRYLAIQKENHFSAAETENGPFLWSNAYLDSLTIAHRLIMQRRMMAYCATSGQILKQDSRRPHG
jgi:hypothetical protein